MSEQVNVQRIGAYAWCLILTICGGALIFGALWASSVELPATIIAETGTPPGTIDAQPDGTPYSEGERTGITQVGNLE